MNKTGNKEGRPPLWTDPKVLQKLVDNYFETEKNVTLSGLAEALDISRSSLYNYGEKDGFLDIIKKARRKVEKRYEEHLIYSNQPTGVIFALKNMGWSDKIETDLTSGGEKIRPLLGGISRDESSNSDKETSDTPKED